MRPALVVRDGQQGLVGETPTELHLFVWCTRNLGRPRWVSCATRMQIASMRGRWRSASKLLWGLFHSPFVFCSRERTKRLSLNDYVKIAAMIDSKHGFCLWGTAVYTTLSSRCLRGHGLVPIAVLPTSPSPTPAGTLLLLACSSEEQRRGRPACPRESEDGPGCSSSTLTRTPPEAKC